MNGLEQKAATQSKEIPLDFSGLFGKATSSPTEPTLEHRQGNNTTQQETPTETPTRGLQGNGEQEQARKLYHQEQREREEQQRNLEIYKTYQSNIKHSSQLQTEILKGISAGVDIYTLFLKAAKAISLMTDNELFYRQASEDVKAIYGAGLQEPLPLQIEIDAMRERLQRLTEAQDRETQTDSKERISRAIKAHKDRIAALEALIVR